MPSPSLGVPAVWRCRAVSTFWAGTSFRCPCLAPPTVGSTAGFSLIDVHCESLVHPLAVDEAGV